MNKMNEKHMDWKYVLFFLKREIGKNYKIKDDEIKILANYKKKKGGKKVFFCKKKEIIIWMDWRITHTKCGIINQS